MHSPENPFIITYCSSSLPEVGAVLNKSVGTDWLGFDATVMASQVLSEWEKWDSIVQKFPWTLGCHA